METIVVEEKIFNSKDNVRSLLTDLRKVYPTASNSTSNFTLVPNNSFKISNCGFFHFHSNSCISLQIKKDGQSITTNSQFFTLIGKLDQVILTNIQDKNVEVYITYAC